MKTVRKPSYITIEALAQAGMKNLPDFLRSSEHLIYSSPATLAFNSPGAEGFGVKRAGLAIPGSVMLVVSPGCCGRNTSLISRIPAYDHRFFYFNLEEKDVVTGRHLVKIPQAVREVAESLDEPPSVVMICITCVDALLGTDMERVCRKAQEAAGVPVRPCYMYALTREGSRPPMVHVRQSLYELLEPLPRRSDAVNLLGFFAPLRRDCELYDLLRQAGVREIREISTCGSFDEFEQMGAAHFNLLLNPEGRFAARDLSKRLGMPYIELARLYDIDRLKNQYRALGQALGVTFEDTVYEAAAREACKRFAGGAGRGLKLAVGERLNADPFEMTYALTRAGLTVSEVYGTVTDENFPWIRALAQMSPETKVFSNLDPSMMDYDAAASDVTFALGADARYYHPDAPGIDWNSEVQPFGYAGVRALYEEMERAVCAAEGRPV